MNSQLVVGVGNIYASEALFRARIAPRRAARRLTRREAAALAQAIKNVLSAAIEIGGTTLARLRQCRRRTRIFPPEIIRLRACGLGLPCVQVAGQAVRPGSALDVLVFDVSTLTSTPKRRIRRQYTRPTPSPRGSDAASTLPVAKSQVMTCMLPHCRLDTLSVWPLACNAWISASVNAPGS